MNYALAILAGAVQGLTEFLPISSTGHLIVFEHFFNISQNDFGLAFDASLHLGTLAAVLIFFFKDYLEILKIKNKLFLKIIVATLPAIFFGLFFESQIESSLRQLWIVGTALILFSGVMFYSERKSLQNKTGKSLSVFDSLIIGFAQALALIPGISRSGSTISAGLFLNLSRQEAAKFAFMISGPIIAGAGAKKFLQVFSSSSLSPQEAQFFIIGIISSAVFGYLTIKYFLKYLATSSLNPFIYYRIGLGILLIVTSLV